MKREKNIFIHSSGADKFFVSLKKEKEIGKACQQFIKNGLGIEKNLPVFVLTWILTH